MTDIVALTRHTTVYMVDLSDNAQSAKALSSVVVYQSMLDGINSHVDAGEIRLLLVGKYLDTFTIENGKRSFLTREVRLENRQLDERFPLADLI